MVIEYLHLVLKQTARFSLKWFYHFIILPKMCCFTSSLAFGAVRLLTFSHSGRMCNGISFQSHIIFGLLVCLQRERQALQSLLYFLSLITSDTEQCLQWEISHSLWQQSTWLPHVGTYTVDNWIDLQVKKKGSENSVNSMIELRNHWVCLGCLWKWKADKLDQGSGYGGIGALPGRQEVVRSD